MHAMNHERTTVRSLVRWGIPAAALTLASASLLAGAGARADEDDGAGAMTAYHVSCSGWNVASAGADVDGSMSGGNDSTEFCRGTFGASVNHSMADYADWDYTSFCDFDPDTGIPRGIELVAIAASNILVTPSGDQVYREMSNSPPSTGCVNYTTLESHGTIYLDVVGGTGRFKGASGNSVLRYTTVNRTHVQDSLMGVEEGSFNYDE